MDENIKHIRDPDHVRSMGSISRWRGTANLFQKLRVSDKWKGRFEKIGNYFYNILDDYKTVAIEIVKDARDTPIKATFYITTITSLFVLYKTNPKEEDFLEELIDNGNELHMIGKDIRNPKSEKHISSILEAQRDGLLRYRSLLFFSLVYLDNFSKDADLYEARCKLIKPHWKDFHKTIIDVGILRRFVYLQEAMIDYDINPDEWTEDGRPRNPAKIGSLV